MRAAVFHAVGDIRIEPREVPEPGKGEVLVRVAACGICGTDRHILHGEFDVVPPIIIGHEYSGEITAVGPDVTDFRVGERVAMDPNMPCGVCRPCQRGQVHLCDNLTALGVNYDGGFAEYSVVPTAQCYKLPEHVSLLEGSLAEPLACCLRGIQQAHIQPGDRVAVIGGGAIGQILAQLARLTGAGKLVLSDLIEERRSMAEQLGYVDETVDPHTSDALLGWADVVLEAVGSVTTTQQALQWAAPGATIVWFGVTPPGDMAAIEPNLVFRKELTIRGARINPFTHTRAIAMLDSGRLNLEPLITKRISLDELPGFLAAAPGKDTKTVVIPA
ncbi:MAG: zinc-dependent alcohol dehydrogenase family protein [Chloroflexi bacterium]|nr:zinc-dependent alcohol dehydrogenase family protein [Chloroflexota bacterium]